MCHFKACYVHFLKKNINVLMKFYFCKLLLNSENTGNVFLNDSRKYKKGNLIVIMLTKEFLSTFACFNKIDTCFFSCDFWNGARQQYMIL